MDHRDFPGGPAVKTLTSNARNGVQSLVGELKSHRLCRSARFFLKRRDIGAEAIFKETVAENFLKLVKVQTTKPRRSTNSMQDKKENKQ